MELAKTMRLLGLHPDRRSDVKEFADGMERGIYPIPDELRGIVTSKNGLCEWFRHKDFINIYSHGISFERVSLLFGDILPAGDEVIFADPIGTGDEQRKEWGLDFRDRIVAKIGGESYFIIQVSGEHVNSGLVHLVSAFKVSRRVVEDAMYEHTINSSVNVLERVMVGYFKERAASRSRSGGGSS